MCTLFGMWNLYLQTVQSCSLLCLTLAEDCYCHWCTSFSVCTYHRRFSEPHALVVEWVFLVWPQCLWVRVQCGWKQVWIQSGAAILKMGSVRERMYGRVTVTVGCDFTFHYHTLFDWLLHQTARYSAVYAGMWWWLFAYYIMVSPHGRLVISAQPMWTPPWCWEGMHACMCHAGWPKPSLADHARMCCTLCMHTFAIYCTGNPVLVCPYNCIIIDSFNDTFKALMNINMYSMLTVHHQIYILSCTQMNYNNTHMHLHMRKPGEADWADI